MNEKLIIHILRTIYPIMRPILQSAIEDPESEWDEILMDICDSVFNYNGGNE